MVCNLLIWFHKEWNACMVWWFGKNLIDGVMKCSSQELYLNVFPKYWRFWHRFAQQIKVIPRPVAHPFGLPKWNYCGSKCWSSSKSLTEELEGNAMVGRGREKGNAHSWFAVQSFYRGSRTRWKWRWFWHQRQCQISITKKSLTGSPMTANTWISLLLNQKKSGNTKSFSESRCMLWSPRTIQL